MPSEFIKHDEFRFLVDCGEGTQRQILLSGIGFKKLNKILITHSHLDHILGLAGLLSTLIRWETMEEMDIYGGNDAIDRIEDLIYSVVLKGGHTDAPLNFHRLVPGVFLDEDNFQVSCFPVIHRGSDSFGFRFQEKSHRPFLADKAAELNIPSGPWRRDLVDGKSVQLPDGRLITPDQVLGENVDGTSLVMIGDVGNVEPLKEYVSGADAMTIESTYLEADAEMAKKYSHMTARKSAEFARDAGVKSLFLTHISRRYYDRDVLNEARAVFPSVILAKDLASFTIKKQNSGEQQAAVSETDEKK